MHLAAIMLNIEKEENIFQIKYQKKKLSSQTMNHKKTIFFNNFHQTTDLIIIKFFILYNIIFLHRKES